MSDLGFAKRTLFMLAGPVKMHPRVLDIMSLPALAKLGYKSEKGASLGALEAHRF